MKCLMKILINVFIQKDYIQSKHDMSPNPPKMYLLNVMDTEHQSSMYGNKCNNTKTNAIVNFFHEF
jgi:hypothetical protein